MAGKRCEVPCRSRSEGVSPKIAWGPGAAYKGCRKTKSKESNFLSLLPDIGRSFDLGSGIPRIVIFSPLSLVNGTFDNKSAAREAGFKQASRYAADLKRAEVYVVRGKHESNVLARDYVSALLLGSKGFLIDASGETLPALHEPPQMVAVYGGFIAYGLVNAPMQIRLAVDSSGSLVNSWVEVSVDRATATPMTGKSICKGQIWIIVQSKETERISHRSGPLTQTRISQHSIKNCLSPGFDGFNSRHRRRA
jgi:hypothetical protein